MSLDVDDGEDQKIARVSWNLSKRDSVAVLLFIGIGAVMAALVGNPWSCFLVPSAVVTVFLGFTEEG